MPANKSAVARYKIIDQCLNYKYRPYPSLEYLQEKIADKLDVDITTSTLEKDIHAMRDLTPPGYYAPIAFSRQHGGYYYTEPGYSIDKMIPIKEEDMDAIRFAAATLYQFKNTLVFRKFSDAIEKIHKCITMTDNEGDDILDKYVSFETHTPCKGMEMIEDLLAAIKEKLVVRFSYENIYKETNREHTVHPYLLKEYRNRWYLIAYAEDKDDFLTFGLDRISNLTFTKKAFTRKKSFDPDSFLKHSFGITESDSKPVNVVLSFDPVIGKLVKNQPLHPSQKILADNAKKLTVSIDVIKSPGFTH